MTKKEEELKTREESFLVRHRKIKGKKGRERKGEKKDVQSEGKCGGK